MGVQLQIQKPSSCDGRVRSRRYPRYNLVRTRPRSAQPYVARVYGHRGPRGSVVATETVLHRVVRDGGRDEGRDEGERVSRTVSACNRTFIQNHYLQPRGPYAYAQVDADA